MGLVEVDKLGAEFDVALDWQPFELRPDAPDTGWPLPEYIRARHRSPDDPLKRRARELGVTLVQREWIPSTRRAHESTEHARAQGRLAPFHAAVLRAYWSEGKDLHDWAVLEAAATEAGIDPTAMRAQVEAGALRDAVTQRVRQAHALGIHAVPTFVIADHLVVQGAQSLDVFRQAMRRLGVAPR